MGEAVATGEFEPLPVPTLVQRLDATARRIETPLPGGTIVWRVWGAGPPVVLIHGGSGSWLHWIRNIEGLAAHATLIVPDLPSLGESSPGPMPFDAATWSAPLRDGIDAIIGADTPFVLVGFSFGAIFAGNIAHVAGARVQSLVLIGPAGFGRGEQPLTWTLRSWRNLPTIAERMAAHRHNLTELMLAEPASVDDLALYVQTTVTAQSRFDSRGAAISGTLLPILPGIVAPIVAIYGERDATARDLLDKRAQQLRELHPNSEWHLLPGIGHWALFEAPDAVNAILMAVTRAACGSDA
jgi:pimeloyl-ACP methyl ester carboxylesterase